MFISLFLKECKQMLKCLTYYVIVICMIMFYMSQVGDFEMLQKPAPNQADYGSTYSNDEAIIMQKTVDTLAIEAIKNNYITYPIGFYKVVTLNDKKKAQMDEILIEVTGMTMAELQSEYERYSAEEMMTYYEFPVKLSSNLTYEKFKSLMKEADRLLGGGSSYNETFLKANARVPMTYEEALEEYEEIVERDRYTGAYARLFCDYMGIVLAILPVFMAVTRELRDRRARANEVIYSRRASSFYIIFTRYLAMLSMLLLPVILISILPTVESVYFGFKEGITTDPFAFLKYIFGWLLPTMMAATAVGVFFTQLADTAIAILIQGFWWFASVFLGVINIKGGYGWNLIPRHNTLGSYQVFHDNFNILVTNRITYALAAILLVIGTAILYDNKRKGKIRLRGKISKNNTN